LQGKADRLQKDDSADNPLSGSVATRLRDFLRALPTPTCIRIMEALEHAKLAGESFPGADLIAAELGAIVSSQRRRRPRGTSPQRYFFALFEPFLIDEQVSDKQIGRIERASLPAIWNWLARDLAPAEIAAYDEAMVTAILGEDGEKARAHTARLLKVLTPVLKAAVAMRGDEAAQRKAVGQMGGQRIFDDLRDMVVVLEGRDALKAVAERITGPVKQLDDNQAGMIVGTLGPHARDGAALLPFAAALAMTKLAHPWQIVRVAAIAAESHQVARIASTPFGIIIDLLVADVERLVIRAEAARQAHDVGRLAAAARDFAQHVRALVTDLDMAPDLACAKRLGVMRARMAQLLRPEIETLPGRVRRILKARPPDATGRETIDPLETASVEAGLDILLVAKSHAAELALNEVTLRVFSDLQGFLDAGVNPLLDGMRSMTGGDKAFRLQQLDAAVKIAQRILGATYAALLAKAVDVAAGERRPAAKGA
jgi:hypothetical protein